MQLSKNQKVCVEIVATDKSNPSFICVIFFGVISHSVIYETFRQKVLQIDKNFSSFLW